MLIHKHYQNSGHTLIFEIEVKLQLTKILMSFSNFFSILRSSFLSDKSFFKNPSQLKERGVYQLTYGYQIKHVLNGKLHGF